MNVCWHFSSLRSIYVAIYVKLMDIAFVYLSRSSDSQTWCLVVTEFFSDQVAVARIMSRLERNFFAPEVREPRHVSFHPSRSNGNMTDISCLSTSAYLLQYHMEHRDYFSRTASANPHKMDLSFDEPSKPLRNVRQRKEK